MQNRARVDDHRTDLVGFAHARIDHWIGRTRDPSPDGYPAAVALLRSIYDMVDRLKSWEEARGQDGAALFRETCARLDAAQQGDSPPRRGLASVVAGIGPAIQDFAAGLRRRGGPARSKP